ncbi:MAG: beta-lactamase family protein [Cyclobacteriaceae bacterium]|nr:beta-lactamase family protein [Cyclobacteriaceae bacterium]
MSRISICLILVLACACAEKKTTRIAIRPETSTLKIGEPTPVTSLKQHAADTFRLDLDSGVYVYGFADQINFDLAAKVFGPDKARIANFDGPDRGHEPFYFTTRAAGVYKVVIEPFEEQAGNYTLVVKYADFVATDLEGRADQIMARYMSDADVTPGATVAVQKDGKIIFSKGYGYADLESNRKNTPGTIFHIASVSKQFTAFAIAMLADQGKISIDDDIRKYIPELNDFGSVITINHLVHHTSGLRDQWNLLTMAGWRMDDVITQKQIMRMISRQKELNFKPGDEWLYCNTGFTLMAEIVSRVTGETFQDWTRKNMFEPLGMKSTQFYVDHQRIVEDRAYSYFLSPEGYKKSVLSYANAGATSLFTTVEDLTLWAINFETMTVGNANVMAMMNQKFVLSNGDTSNYAFGQDVTKYRGLNVAAHGGGDAGYRTYLLRYPDQHASISVFSNLASFNPGGFANALGDILLAKELEPEKPLPPPPAPAPSQEPEKKFDKSSVKLADYTGTFYSDELMTSYTLVVEKDTIRGKHQRHDDLNIIPKAPDTFETRFLGDLVFVRDRGGKVTGFKASNGRVRNLAFKKQ